MLLYGTSEDQVLYFGQSNDGMVHLRSCHVLFEDEWADQHDAHVAAYQAAQKEGQA